MVKQKFDDEEKAAIRKLDELRSNRRKKEVVAAIDAGFLAQGVRLVDPASNGEEGVNLVLSPEEAKKLSPVLASIAAARLKQEK